MAFMDHGYRNAIDELLRLGALSSRKRSGEELSMHSCSRDP